MNIKELELAVARIEDLLEIQSELLARLDERLTDLENSGFHLTIGGGEYSDGYGYDIPEDEESQV